MVEGVLISLSFIIAIAAIATIIARIIKQPAIIAYLVTGIIAGPLFFNLMGGETLSFIQIFAHIGVAFLLFIVGLSLDLRLLREVGFVSVLAGILGMIVTAGLGYLIAIALGLGFVAALYLGAVLAFSSTVVVVKILSDKKEIDTLHGRLALGILIVQDFVAAIVLMAIPLITNNSGLNSIFTKLVTVVAFIVAIFLFSAFILNKFLDYLARSQEALFLFGIAWALVLAAVFSFLGFSLEIGALIGGMSLASSKYTLDLGGKMKPLRDFFVVLFFVFFGSQMTGAISGHLITMAIIFSLFIFIGKPLVTMIILRTFGYKKRTNFLAGISLAQISEFSLILTLLGFTLGHLSQEIMSLAVLISLITIAISSYSIYYSSWIYNKISGLLQIFEGKREINTNKKESYDILLFGYHRMGYKMLKTLKQMKASFAVIDYNPKVVLSLGCQGINSFYGDASDKEFLSEIGLDKAKIVISTVPDFDSNLAIKNKLEEFNSKAAFIATAEQPRTALDLYKEGVDFVLIPHHLGGEYAAHLIEQFNLDKAKYKEKGKKHLEELEKAKNNSKFVY